MGGITFAAVHEQGAQTVAREAAAAGSPASCLCPASAPMPSPVRRTSARAGAANG
jgi:hypothetical protein